MNMKSLALFVLRTLSVLLIMFVIGFYGWTILQKNAEIDSYKMKIVNLTQETEARVTECYGKLGDVVPFPLDQNSD